MKLTTFLEKLDSYEGPDSKGDYLGLCPGHADGSPSLLVGQNATDGRLLIYCRAGCSKEHLLGEMGLELADLFTADDKPDSAAPVSKAVAATEGPTIGEVAALREYTETTRDYLQDDENAKGIVARQYIAERFGLGLEDARDLGIGLDPGGPWYDGTLGFGSSYVTIARLTIPFRSFDGVVRGLQGRALGDHKVRWSGPVNPEGRAFSKYAYFDMGTGLDSIVVTEGPGDALTAVAAGFDALAIRGSAVANNAGLLAELAEGLAGRRIVLAGDNDSAGAAYNKTLLTAFTEAGLNVFTLPWRFAPAGTGDVTEWREKDAAGFQRDFQRAVDAAEHPTDDEPDRADTDPAGRLTAVGLASLVYRNMEGPEGEPGILFVAGQGFYIWRGTHWEADQSRHLTRREVTDAMQNLLDEAAEGVLRADGEAAKEEAGEWLSRVAQAVHRFEQTINLSGLLVELETRAFIRQDLLNGNHELLTVNNGTVNLRTGVLQEHRREDFITRKVDASYRADEEAPQWETFLRQIFPGDAELPGYVQRLTGYGVTGFTSEQCFAVLWGTGANGKSVFTDVLTDVFREVSETTSFSTFEQKPAGGIPNDLAALNGARLVFASEGEQGKLMAESIIKRVTGGDMISARFMRQEFFSFSPTFLIMLATNHKPRFQGQDEGLWRRVKLVPFERYFKPHERDHKLTKNLKAERDGILTWTVRGAMEWFARDDLGEPASVVDATAAYRDSADGLLGFLEVMTCKEPDYRIRAVDVFDRWKDFMVEEGVREGDIWNPRTFYAALEERGFARKKLWLDGKAQWVIQNMRMLTPDEMAGNFEPANMPEGG